MSDTHDEEYITLGLGLNIRRYIYEKGIDRGNGVTECITYKDTLVSKNMLYDNTSIDIANVFGPNKYVTYTSVPTNTPLVLRLGLLLTTITIEARCNDHWFEGVYLLYPIRDITGKNDIIDQDGTIMHTGNMYSVIRQNNDPSIQVVPTMYDMNTFSIEVFDGGIPLNRIWRVNVLMS